MSFLARIISSARIVLLLTVEIKRKREVTLTKNQYDAFALTAARWITKLDYIRCKNIIFDGKRKECLVIHAGKTFLFTCATYACGNSTKRCCYDLLHNAMLISLSVSISMP